MVLENLSRSCKIKSVKPFVHLHVHSHYSLLDGLAKIDQLIGKAKEFQMPALALTDHGVMYGVIEFYQKCREAGIKPILGCELYIAPRTIADKTPKIDNKLYHITILVKNRIGYKNLLKLCSIANTDGFYYKPRVDKDVLSKYGEGLIALSGCLQGKVARLASQNKMDKAKKAILEYQKIFGQNNFYLEIQPHKVSEQKKANEGLINLSKKLNVPLVATNDIHYLNKEDKRAHEILLAVNTNKEMDDVKRLSLKDFDISMNSPKEMEEFFKDTTQAINNTIKIADQCNLELELGKLILPEFSTPDGLAAHQYLEKLCREGFKTRYPTPSLEIKERLEYELSVIEKAGFSGYFLIVQDFVNWAKNQGITVGPGRGSAAGSIVSYCINITDLDPIKYNLLFERFLNPERISPPDIDLDFADNRRDEVIDYVRQRYGEERVAQIITFGTMAARGSIRDAGRALKINYNECDKIAKLIPFGSNLEEAMVKEPELKKMYEENPKVNELINIAKKLEGVARHASTHAAGIVITKEPLTEYLPLQRATKGGSGIVTQYSMLPIEAIGLLKIDFLGLANLTVIQSALKLIERLRKINLNISQIPLDDQKTFDLLSRGETTGVFQLESDGMKRYLKELKPSELGDIIAMVALYRPGPMELIPEYIKGKRGKKEITYLDPRLKPILKDTYGIAVYQEQVLQIARVLAGFSLGEADVLRKAIGKKIKKLLLDQRKKFIEGCVNNNVKKEVAKQLFDFIEPFARYSFNRAHSVCYAMIAYRTAYLKANYSAEFMAALLTSDYHNLDRVAIEISECERMGIKVFPPNVNESETEFGVIDDYIRFGLGAIKNVGWGAAKEIVKEREKNGKYKSLEDFIKRLGSKIINKKTIENLGKAGALDDFAERNKILASIDIILKYAHSREKQANSNQINLFASNPKNENIYTPLKLMETEPAVGSQCLAWEKELLGIYLTDHPLKQFQEKIAELGLNSINQIKEKADSNPKARVRIAVVIGDIKKINTKNNSIMIFARLEDESGFIEGVVFPKILENNKEDWNIGNLILIEGRLDNKSGGLKILVDNICPLEKSLTTNSFSSQTEKTLIVTLPREADKSLLDKIKNLILTHPGEQKVQIRLPQNNHYKIINIKNRVKLSPLLKNNLYRELGEENIEIISTKRLA